MTRSGTVIDLIWDDHHLVRLEREIWIQVMIAQWGWRPDLITDTDIRRSQAAKNMVNLDRIHARERVTKHDLKARLEEFAHISGHERLHLGMTSADIVENTYSIRIRESLMALGLNRRPFIQRWMDLQPFRGIRGPVGSDQDQLELLGSSAAVSWLNQHLADTFGFHKVADAPTQTLPRSIDFNLATLIAQELSQPYSLLVASLAGCFGDSAWLEGDVATSVIRRYCWPTIFKVAEEAIGAEDAQTGTGEEGSQEADEKGDEEDGQTSVEDGHTIRLDGDQLAQLRQGLGRPPELPIGGYHFNRWVPPEDTIEAQPRGILEGDLRPKDEGPTQA